MTYYAVLNHLYFKGENLDILKNIVEYAKDSRVYEKCNKIAHTKLFPIIRINIKSSMDNIIIEPTKYRFPREKIANLIYMNNVFNSLFYTIEFNKYHGKIIFHSRLDGDLYFSVIGRPFKHINSQIKLYVRGLYMEMCLFITH